MDSYKNPVPTVDVVILMHEDPNDEILKDRIVLVRRKNPPHGWALPGGFVNEGESYAYAAIREVKEETGLDIDLTEQFHTYSDPARDPRRHVATTVFLAVLVNPDDLPVGGDDAAEARVVSYEEAYQEILAFDHRRIIQDVVRYVLTGYRPLP